MTTPQDGGQAFPSHIEHDIPDSPCGRWCHVQGMTLRDYFAGQALTGIISASSSAKRFAKINASDAYALADAMLKERGKP